MGWVVRVGITAVIYKDWKILMWKRKTNNWKGTWWFTGWHLEIWETWEDCAKRETLEEVWIEIENISLLWVTNDILNPEKHYVSIFLKAKYKSGNVKTLEPDKLESRERVDPTTLPTPLFLPIDNFLEGWQKL